MRGPLTENVLCSRYRLGNVIGRGGMGTVYRAEDRRLHGRPCAVKILDVEAVDPRYAARFDRELRVISALRGPHTVQVLDTGHLADGRAFIVMELIEGPTLASMLSTDRLHPMRAARLIRDVLLALHEAHGLGIVHRDLKPTNVMVLRDALGRESAKVLDFGIAKDLRAAEPELTGRGVFVGTPRYMAPEQFLGNPATPATDLYAAGVLLYTAITGRPPFVPEDPVPSDLRMMPADARLAWLHIHRVVSPLGGVSPALNEFLGRLLAKQPELRPGDAHEALQLLEDLPEMATTGQLPASRTGTQMGMPALHLAEPPTAISETGGPIAGETTHEPLRVRMRRLAVAGLVLGGALTLASHFLAPEFLDVDLPSEADVAPPPAHVAATATQVAQKPQLCHDAVTSSPTGADVWAGGTWLGNTPLVLARACDEVRAVAIKAAGYQTQHLTFPRPAAQLYLPVSLIPDTRVAGDAPPSPVPAPDGPETPVPGAAGPAVAILPTRLRASGRRGGTASREQRRLGRLGRIGRTPAVEVVVERVPAALEQHAAPPAPLEARPAGPAPAAAPATTPPTRPKPKSPLVF